VESVLWKLLGTGSAIAAAGLAERAVGWGWRVATGKEPPITPEDPEINWGEAVTWALVSGAVIGIARLAATRKAAAYYRRSTGSLPKALLKGH